MTEKNDVKKNKKFGLGRGLEALIPGRNISQESASRKEYMECDIDAIRSNPYQPRQKFSEDELNTLADSIRKHGILQPLLVRQTGNGYELAAGERRLRAAKLAGLSKAPVVIKDISDSNLLQISIIENIQREELNPIEKSHAYDRLMTEFRMTQEEVAACLGISRPSVTNILRLRQLPKPIQDAVFNNELSAGHAKVLLSAENEAIQSEAWRAVISKGLSVRQTEDLIRKLTAAKNKPDPPPPDPETNYFSTISDRLTQYFGTKVQIKRQGEKGRIEIDFYSNDDLNRVLEFFKTDGFG